MEFFSEGFLTVKKGTHYYFLDADGNSVAGPRLQVSGHIPAVMRQWYAMRMSKRNPKTPIMPISTETRSLYI